MIVVLVCGGRDYSGSVDQALDHVLNQARARGETIAIRHGAARGADSLAGAWARSRGVIEQPCPADWRLLGYKAGPVRNAAMIAPGDVRLVVAFPGGRGTADMVRKARTAGIEVWQVS